MPKTKSVDETKPTLDAAQTMEALVEEAGDSLIPFHTGEVVNALVTAVTKGSVWVDVAGVSIGIIPEREFSFGTLDLKPGDTVSAYVLSLEDKEGHVVLSLRRADRERLWITLKDKFENAEVVQAKVVEANKGGLMAEIGGVVGFLPISQLASNHYPRSVQGNRDEISTKLSELVGETFNVKIINFDKTTNKLIFSERAAGDAAAEERLSKIEVGSIVKGKITGIVDFGLFVHIGDDVEGLVHISEVSWDRVNDLRTLYSVGDQIDVQVVGISDGKVSLSIKRLSTDPWVAGVSQMHVGDVIDGTITRITPFGAFVKLNDVVDGLVHVSELAMERVEDPNTIVSIGEKKQFKVMSIDQQAHRISLSLKAMKAKAKDAVVEKPSEPKTVVAEEPKTKPKKAPKKATVKKAT